MVGPRRQKVEPSRCRVHELPDSHRAEGGVEARVMHRVRARGAPPLGDEGGQVRVLGELGEGSPGLPQRQPQGVEDRNTHSDRVDMPREKVDAASRLPGGVIGPRAAVAQQWLQPAGTRSAWPADADLRVRRRGTRDGVVIDLQVLLERPGEVPGSVRLIPYLEVPVVDGAAHISRLCAMAPPAPATYGTLGPFGG